MLRIIPDKSDRVTTVPQLNEDLGAISLLARFGILDLPLFLNQGCTGHRLARAWFLEIDLARKVCVCVCVCSPLRLVITSGMIWTPYDWLNKFYSFCMAAIVGIVSRHGLVLSPDPGTRQGMALEIKCVETNRIRAS